MIEFVTTVVLRAVAVVVTVGVNLMYGLQNAGAIFASGGSNFTDAKHCFGGRHEQRQVSHGTATHRLGKMLLFHISGLQKLGRPGRQ